MKKTNSMDISFLDKQDIYSVIFSAIYASDIDDNYMLLSDLIYALDDKSFKNFISLFEGQTITIPPIEKITSMLKSLVLYAKIEVEGWSPYKAMKFLNISNDKSTVYLDYLKIKKLITSNRIELGGILNGFPSNVDEIIRSDNK